MVIIQNHWIVAIVARAVKVVEIVALVRVAIADLVVKAAVTIVDLVTIAEALVVNVLNVASIKMLKAKVLDKINKVHVMTIAVRVQSTSKADHVLKVKAVKDVMKTVAVKAKGKIQTEDTTTAKVDTCRRKLQRLQNQWAKKLRASSKNCSLSFKTTDQIKKGTLWVPFLFLKVRISIFSTI